MLVQSYIISIALYLFLALLFESLGYESAENFFVTITFICLASLPLIGIAYGINLFINN